MYEYIIEKRDGKFICVNWDNQDVEGLITALPENNVQFDKNFAYLKYNGYLLFISRAAFGGFHLRSWTCWGTTAIEVGAGPQRVHDASFLRIDWEMRGDDTYEKNGTGEWSMCRYACGIGEDDIVWKYEDIHCTFNELMQAVVKAYPFIDENKED